MMNAISLYLIHGGLLPTQPEGAVKDLSVDEYERFYGWEKAGGLEIEKKEDVSEMYLQVAADKLKNMFREILSNELKKEDGQKNSFTLRRISRKLSSSFRLLAGVKWGRPWLAISPRGGGSEKD